MEQLRRRGKDVLDYRVGLLQNDFLDPGVSGGVHGYQGQPGATQEMVGLPSRRTQQQTTYAPPSQGSSTVARPASQTYADHQVHFDLQRSLQKYISRTGTSMQNARKGTSIRRAQTPLRTANYYNNASTTPYGGGGPSYSASLNDYNLVNPAEDLAANSIFSYGCLCCQCVRTTEVGIVETWGRYEDLLDPGFYCLPWPISDISGRLSLRIQQMDIVCESRTQDSVFCNISVSVPFRIMAERAYDAYYRLSDPTIQIQSYVFDIVRSSVPKMTLDEVFINKSIIADEVSKHLQGFMTEYGYEIIHALVTDVRPVASVKQSMNEMNASKRLKIAMTHLAEAERVRIVKEAEAHAESLYLNGVGIAGQRRALVQELKNSFNDGRSEVNNAEVMNLLLVTQYNDLIQEVSSSPSPSDNGTSSLLLHFNPGHVQNLHQQVRHLHGMEN